MELVGFYDFSVRFVITLKFFRIFTKAAKHKSSVNISDHHYTYFWWLLVVTPLRW